MPYVKMKCTDCNVTSFIKIPDEFCRKIVEDFAVGNKSSVLLFVVFGIATVFLAAIGLLLAPSPDSKDCVYLMQCTFGLAGAYGLWFLWNAWDGYKRSKRFFTYLGAEDISVAFEDRKIKEFCLIRYLSENKDLTH